MRPLLYIICIILIAACKQSVVPKKLVTGDLKYSAYFWHFNEISNGWEFYLVYSIDIGQNGQFVLMRHDEFKKSPRYFNGGINDTVWNCINSTISKDTFKTNYSYLTNPNFIYDGLTYCLDYKTDNGSRKKILFIPENSPEKIAKLGEVLDTLIYRAKKVARDTMALTAYTLDLKHFAYKFDAPPPPPSPPKVFLSPSKALLFKPPKPK